MFNGAPFNIEEVEKDLKELCVKITAGMYPQLNSVLLDSDQGRKRYKLHMIMSMCDIIDKMESKEINDSEEEYIVGMLDDAIEVNQSELKTRFSSEGSVSKRVSLRQIADLSVIDENELFDRSKLFHDVPRQCWGYELDPSIAIYIPDAVDVPTISQQMCEHSSKCGKPLRLRFLLATIKHIISD